ncbi:MAG: DUF3854 domain-containing protein [Myxacorys californica WJT36-NPBG1]|nr:DUF3854 domain-containing protein [Myxacorys californica WJT36-NPBG1]
MQFVRDTAIDNAGDVTYPIAEALNWNVTRFGRRHRENQFAVLLKQETGGTWQSKLSHPFKDSDGRIQKYTAPKGEPGSPKGSNDRAWLPPVPPSIREKVAKRYGVDVPMDGLFWPWVAEQTELEIVLTEGGGKSGSVLCDGTITIALYGCNSGNSPDLEPFLKKGRKFIIAFDQDSDLKTRLKVNAGICALAVRILKAEGSVKIASWNPESGKGIDDLRFNKGHEEARRAIADAVPFRTWKTSYLTELTIPVDYEITGKRITDADIAAIRRKMPSNTKLIYLRAHKGAGKTRAMSLLTQGKTKLVLGHRLQLMAELGRVLGVPDLQSLKRKAYKGGESFRDTIAKLESLALCVNSFHEDTEASFSADEWKDVDFIVLDEVEQVIWHLLESGTLNEGKRVKVAREFFKLLQHWASPESHTVLIAADADLSLATSFISDAIGEVPTFTVSSTYKNESFNVIDYPNKEVWIKSLISKAGEGKKLFITSSGQAKECECGTMALESLLKGKFPKLRILRIDSVTLELADHPAYGCMSDLDKVLINYDVVIVSPSLETGISIDIRGHFNYVFSYAGGNTPVANTRQTMNRPREPIERHLFAVENGCAWVPGTGNLCSPKQIRESIDQMRDAKLNLLHMSELEEGKLSPDLFEGCLDTYARMAARQNAGNYKHHESLIEGLKSEGCNIIQADGDCDRSSIKLELEQNKEALSEAELIAAENARQLTPEEYEKIKGKVKRDDAQRFEAMRYEISAKYATQDVTKLLAGRDGYGWYKPLRLHFFLTVGREHLTARDARKVRAELKDGQIFAPDLNRCTIADKIVALERIGFAGILSRMEGGEAIPDNDPALVKLKETCDLYSKEIKKVLGVDLKPSNAPHTMLGKLLDLVGLTKWETSVKLPYPEIGINSSTSRKIPGTDSQKVKAWKLPKLDQLLSQKQKDAKGTKKVNQYTAWAIDDGRAEVFARWMADETEKAFSSTDETASRQNVPENQQNEAEDDLASSEEQLADLIEMWSLAIGDVEIQQSLINSWQAVISDRHLAQLPGYLDLVRSCNIGPDKMTGIGYEGCDLSPISL